MSQEDLILKLYPISLYKHPRFCPLLTNTSQTSINI